MKTLWRKNLVFIFVFAALFSIGRSLSNNSFVGTKESLFVRNGKPFYFNGFNAYWLMMMASDPLTRDKVTSTFEQASKCGMNVARTMAFSDGGSNALQTSPGSYNENMFKGLDFVVSEAKRHGLYLILSLVNNWESLGGKKQYVQWARDQGQQLNNDDAFFTNPVVKGYYKNHVKAVLTRVNTFTGVAYKDDATILGWELMNEPCCLSDVSGKSIQDWVVEMGSYVKSIDNKHLVEVGLEGFYGESMPEKKQNNPNTIQIGTDFISNNLVPQIDFTTIHVYPEQWIPNINNEAQEDFAYKWIKAHVNDSKSIIGKPLLVTEFGKSSKSTSYNVSVRDKYFTSIFNDVFYHPKNGDASGGALFWQVMAQGMDSWGDGFEVILEQNPTTAAIITQQSHQISSLNQ